MVSVLIAKPVARKTHKEDSGYDRRCILGLLLTDGALSHWQMSHERLLLSSLSCTYSNFPSPLLPLQ